MAQHAITAVHYRAGKIDLVAVHKIVDKQLGSTELTLDTARRISVGECANLVAIGEEVCIVRRTERHTWEVVCDVKVLPHGNDISGVDILDQPNDALRDIPAWD